MTSQLRMEEFGIKCRDVSCEHHANGHKNKCKKNHVNAT